MIGRYPQDATVWVHDGTFDDFGNPTYRAPQNIKVRWEQKSALFLNQDGNQERAESTVYVQDDYPQGKIKLGVHSDAQPPKDAWIIREFRKIPSFRGDKYERRLLLT